MATTAEVLPLSRSSRSPVPARLAANQVIDPPRRQSSVQRPPLLVPPSPVTDPPTCLAEMDTLPVASTSRLAPPPPPTPYSHSTAEQACDACLLACPACSPPVGQLACCAPLPSPAFLGGFPFGGEECCDGCDVAVAGGGTGGEGGGPFCCDDVDCRPSTSSSSSSTSCPSPPPSSSASATNPLFHHPPPRRRRLDAVPAGTDDPHAKTWQEMMDDCQECHEQQLARSTEEVVLPCCSPSAMGGVPVVWPECQDAGCFEALKPMEEDGKDDCPDCLGGLGLVAMGASAPGGSEKGKGKALEEEVDLETLLSGFDEKTIQDIVRFPSPFSSLLVISDTIPRSFGQLNCCCCDTALHDAPSSFDPLSHQTHQTLPQHIHCAETHRQQHQQHQHLHASFPPHQQAGTEQHCFDSHAFLAVTGTEQHPHLHLPHPQAHLHFNPHQPPPSLDYHQQHFPHCILDGYPSYASQLPSHPHPHSNPHPHSQFSPAPLASSHYASPALSQHRSSFHPSPSFPPPIPSHQLPSHSLPPPYASYHQHPSTPSSLPSPSSTPGPYPSTMTAATAAAPVSLHRCGWADCFVPPFATSEQLTAHVVGAHLGASGSAKAVEGGAGQEVGGGGGGTGYSREVILESVIAREAKKLGMSMGISSSPYAVDGAEEILQLPLPLPLPSANANAAGRTRTKSGKGAGRGKPYSIVDGEVVKEGRKTRACRLPSPPSTSSSASSASVPVSPTFSPSSLSLPLPHSPSLPSHPLSTPSLHPCRWHSCPLSFPSTALLMEHLSVAHVGSGKGRYTCEWEGCERCTPFVPAGGGVGAEYGGEGEEALAQEEWERRRDAREDKMVFRQRQKVMRHLQMHTGASFSSFPCLSLSSLFLLPLLCPRRTADAGP